MRIKEPKNAKKCYALGREIQRLWGEELAADVNFEPIREKMFQAKQKLHRLDPANYDKPVDWDSRLNETDSIIL